tara:strand:- start:36 stop:236 length:201 start_codon:yes stop_codon:yes gene_type:complete
MLKEGQKASHFMSTHRVGEIIDIIHERTNLGWSTGGTLDTRVIIVIKYKNGEIGQYPSGDVIRVYD